MLKLFPIPANIELFLSIVDFSWTTKIEIRDITCRLLKTFNMEIGGSEIKKLNVAGMKSGMYLLSATNKGKQFTGKFLVE